MPRPTRPGPPGEPERLDPGRGACHNPPMRFFNTAGPVRPDDHYFIPPLDRDKMRVHPSLPDRILHVAGAAPPGAARRKEGRP